MLLWESHIGEGHWGFRFCGFGYFLDRFFGFCAKKTFNKTFHGFDVHCSLRIFRFFASGFRFSRKILTVFGLISNAVFGFSNLTFLGSGFSSI